MKKINWTKKQIEVIGKMISMSEEMGWDKGYKCGYEDRLREEKITKKE